MKKIILVCTVLIALVGNSIAGNNKILSKGDKMIKAGIGFTSIGFPIEVAYEQGYLNDLGGVQGLNLGLGGYFAYFGYKENFSYPDSQTGRDIPYSWKYTNIIIGGRAIAHYKLIENFDTYFGVMLGYMFQKLTFDGPSDLNINNPGGGHFSYSGVVGIKYDFNPKFGAYLEAGYGVANVTLGVAMKL